MPSVKEIEAALERPNIVKLQQIGTGLRVAAVLGDRVLVEEIAPETLATKLEKQSLLVIPETHREANTPKPCTGVILMLGTGVSSLDAQVLKEGVAVLFSKYAGTNYTLDEREGLRVLDVSEIMCVLEYTDSIIAPVASERSASGLLNMRDKTE